LPLRDGIVLDIELEPRGFTATIEVEHALAIELIARALRRAPPMLPGDLEDGDMATLGGGLAALVAAVGRGYADALRVRAAGSSEAIFDEGRDERRGWDTGTFHVTVAGSTYTARLHLPAATRAIPRPFRAEHLARLGATPIEIPIVAATTRSSVVELSTLATGDAWMLGTAPWARTLRGDVVLAAPGAERGACAALVEGGRLVLGVGAQDLGGDEMPEEGAIEPITLAVGDVPVVIRVEVGTARMTAREWASLAPGDVVGLARDLAAPVVLRVGGVEMAHGELVDIEGEMGVRILSIHGPEHEP
jgi:flagellar motor switch/type III secretory pathway protein FliN